MIATKHSLAQQTSFQDQISSAQAAGLEEVTIVPGVYNIKSPANNHYQMTLKGLKNLKINAHGVKLVFSNPVKAGLALRDSENVSLHGLTIDYDPLPYTQGVIKTISDDGMYYDMEIHKGYTDDASIFEKRAAAYVFDPKTRLWKKGCWDLYLSRVEKIKDGVLRLWWRNPKMKENEVQREGDWLVLCRRAGGVFRVINCKRVDIDGVVIHAGPGIALQEVNGHGGHTYTYKVTPGPKPIGASEERLFSTCADAFHSSGVKVGPIVKNCLFERMGDDAIAIHGAFELIMQASNSKDILASPKHECRLKPGDKLRLIDKKTYTLKDTAIVTSVTQVDPAQLNLTESFKDLLKVYRLKYPLKQLFKISVDKKMDVAMGDYLSSFDRNGSGFVVKDNIFRHHRARSILVKSCKGIIENNIIKDANQTGIAMGPEFSTWLESTYCQDLIIRGNKLIDIGHGANATQNGSNPKSGAISIFSMTPDHKLATGNENKNITIENNEIINSYIGALMISSGKNIVVKNNIFNGTHVGGKSSAGTAYGIDSNAAVYLVNTDGVTFEDNKVTPGKGTTKILAKGDGVANVAGEKEGLVKQD